MRSLSQHPTPEEFIHAFEQECPPLVRRSMLRKLGFPIAPGTLANYAVLRQGPPFIKISNRVCYRREDLVRFLRERSTCESKT